MASITKRGDWYYLSFHNSEKTPTRKQVALRVRRLVDAKAKARSLEREYLAGTFDPWYRKPTTDSLSSAVERFLGTRRNLAGQTQAKYRSVLGLLVGSVGGARRVASVTPAVLQSFLDSTPKAAITKRTYSTTLSPFFNWLIAEGAIKSNPVAGIRLPRVARAAPRFLKPNEVEALVAAVHRGAKGPRIVDGTSEWLIPVIKANVYLGLRAGEITELQWQDVDTDRGTIQIGGRTDFSTKYGTFRIIPLPPQAAEILMGLPRDSVWVFPSHTGRQLGRQYLSRRFKHYVRAAGLPESVNFHCTRHTAASWLIQGGATLEAVRRFMGHSSVRVTERYAQLSSEAFSGQVASAFERTQRSPSS